MIFYLGDFYCRIMIGDFFSGITKRVAGDGRSRILGDGRGEEGCSFSFLTNSRLLIRVPPFRGFNK